MPRYALLALLLPLAVRSGVASAQSQEDRVPLWGCFERSILHPREHANPFLDTALSGTVRTPAGRTHPIEGFFDGDRTWRLRILATEPGEWRYETRFSDGAPGLSGAFLVTTERRRGPAVHGPLRVSSQNPLWFEHADGTPVYLLAFHLWRIDALEEPVRDATLGRLQRLGFNAIVGPHLTPDRGPWGGPPVERDFTRMNVGWWQAMDRAIEALADRGFVLIPFSILGGTNRLPKPPTPAHVDLFLRYWVARWGGYWNVTYQPFSEWEEGWSEAEVQRIGRRIHELDGGRHLVSMHSLKSNSLTVQRAPWFGYHTVQDKLVDRDPLRYTALAELFRQTPKPILAHECLWEGNLYQLEAGLDVANMTRGAWAIALSGGQINYADEVLPGRKYQTRSALGPNFSDDGSAVEPGGRLYGPLASLARLMRTLPLPSLRPAPERAGGLPCLGGPAGAAVVFVPAGATVRLDLSEARGLLAVRWIAPEDGAPIRAGSVRVGATVSLEPPARRDLVLVVGRQGGRVPGGPGPRRGREGRNPT